MATTESAINATKSDPALALQVSHKCLTAKPLERLEFSPISRHKLKTKIIAKSKFP